MSYPCAPSPPVHVFHLGFLCSRSRAIASDPSTCSPPSSIYSEVLSRGLGLSCFEFFSSLHLILPSAPHILLFFMLPFLSLMVMHIVARSFCDTRLLHNPLICCVCCFVFHPSSQGSLSCIILSPPGSWSFSRILSYSFLSGTTRISQPMSNFQDSSLWVYDNLELQINIQGRLAISLSHEMNNHWSILSWWWYP